jgi:hypothetical protein
MKLWQKYLHEQAPITGYMNYMEDRMKIMVLHKASMTKCFEKFKMVPNQMKRNMGIYQCETPVLESTIQRLQAASQKCANTQFPEKCETFYTQLIPKLEYKIKFNAAQLDTLKRKMGLTSYD